MKLLWVTAYKHLGRESWYSARSFELYMEYFQRIKHLDLVCFAEEPHATWIKEQTGITRVLPYDEKDTFFPKYLGRQKEILASAEFEKIRPGPAHQWPAFQHAEYGLVNFSKTSLVRRASELFPEYTHYGWIDFGYAKEPTDAPPLDWSCDRLVAPDKIIIGSCRDLFFNEKGETMYGDFGSHDRSLAVRYNWNNPRTVLRDFHHLIQGNLYIVPKKLTHWLEKKMDWSIQRHHALGVANHDEPFFLSIMHDFRSLFHIHVKEKWTDGFKWFAASEPHGTIVVSKKDGRLTFQDYGCDSQRNSSLFWCIQQADKLYEWRDFEPVRIMTNDFGPSDGTLCVSRESFDGLVPDYTFHKWDARKENDLDYDELVDRIDVAGRRKFEVAKAAWIGQDSSQYRRTLVEIAKQHPDILECELMNWGQDWHSPSKFVSMDELARKYAVLIDIEGYGYSGRLKHLLWSHRPVIMVERPYKEYYHEHLVSWEHYIPVRRDLSDLVEKVTWALQNPEAQKIAERAYEFSRKHLTRRACYAKWNEILGSERLLWVTAYMDIGRAGWALSQRSFDAYIEAFRRIQHLNPVCFINEPWATQVREQTGHTRILPLEVQDTFIPKYIGRQSEILADPAFRKLIPEFLQFNPEFHYPAYGLVNCAKTCFVRRASELFPGYSHYSWIDFGFAKTVEETPLKFSCDSLIDEKRILVSSFRAMGFDEQDGEPALGPYGVPSVQAVERYNWNNPLKCLTHPPHLIQGNHWVVPRNLTHWLEKEMARSIERNHELNIVRADETFFLPIVHDFRTRFHVHVKPYSDVTWIADMLWRKIEVHFNRIREIIEPSFDEWYGAGSYLISGKSNDYDQTMLEKQLALYRATQGRKRALEIGVHAGHSLLVMLVADPTVVIECIDICIWEHTEKCVQYLQSVFPGRITLHKGDSRSVTGQLTGEFDLVHIDGSHDINVIRDEVGLIRSTPDALFVFDDFDTAGLPQYVYDTFETVRETRCPYRNCIASTKKSSA